MSLPVGALPCPRHGECGDEFRMLEAEVERHRSRAQIERADLERQIVGALRSAIDAHGPITRLIVGSAAKRVTRQIEAARRGDGADTKHRKGKILRIGTVVDGRPEGWAFEGGAIGLEIRADGSQLCAGWSVEELEAISAAQRRWETDAQ